MKTAIILSCLLAGSSMMMKYNASETNTHTAPVYKTSRAVRSTTSGPLMPVTIVISKSKYELYVYDSKGWYATYPVVFGNPSLADKRMEGDRLTPEGTFHIVNKRYHEKWSRYMGLDYPTPQSIEKFRRLKERGIVPVNASPGGGIGIHGTFEHEDFVIDRYNNWTDGCISLKREDVEALYRYVPIGTEVRIQR